MRKKRPVSDAVWKGIIIAELIICYLACLAVVSYIRGAERYRTMTETPLLRSEEFISFTGVPAGASGTLPLENAVPGEAVGYMAWLQLDGLEQMQISFQAECPAEFAGGTLFIDLYNFEADYDNPEQEYQMTVQRGHNEVKFLMDPGETPPDEALLRFFTLDSAGYQLEDIRIYRAEAMPKVPAGLLAGTEMCFLLLAGTVVMWMINRESKRGSPA